MKALILAALVALFAVPASADTFSTSHPDTKVIVDSCSIKAMAGGEMRSCRVERTVCVADGAEFGAMVEARGFIVVRGPGDASDIDGTPIKYALIQAKSGALYFETWVKRFEGRNDMPICLSGFSELQAAA